MVNELSDGRCRIFEHDDRKGEAKVLFTNDKEFDHRYGIEANPILSNRQRVMEVLELPCRRSLLLDQEPQFPLDFQGIHFVSHFSSRLKQACLLRFV